MSGANLDVPNEDPYRSFRRSLIKQARVGVGSARGHPSRTNLQEMHSQSRESQRSKQSKQWSQNNSETQVNTNATMKGRKGFSSVMSLRQHNKVILNDQGRSTEDFLLDLSVPNPMARGSKDNSYMMIEVSDLDLAINKQTSSSRAQTTGGGDYDLSLKLPNGTMNQKSQGRYTGMGGMGRPGSIVANARKELGTL